MTKRYTISTVRRWHEASFSLLPRGTGCYSVVIGHYRGFAFPIVARRISNFFSVLRFNNVIAVSRPTLSRLDRFAGRPCRRNPFGLYQTNEITCY